MLSPKILVEQTCHDLNITKTELATHFDMTPAELDRVMKMTKSLSIIKVWRLALDMVQMKQFNTTMRNPVDRI